MYALFQRNALKRKKRENRQAARNRTSTRNTRVLIIKAALVEFELHKLRLETESVRSNVRWVSWAEDSKTMSSNYQISIEKAEEHVRETSPAVLIAKALIPVITPIKEEKEIDDLRVVHVKGKQEIVNAAIDTSVQMHVVRANVVEGQSVDSGRTIQITSAFGEHEMDELKVFNMEIHDPRHGVVPMSRSLINDMLIRPSDYKGLIENTQLVRNPAILRISSKKEEFINSIDSKSLCIQEVVTDLRFETYTQSSLNIPNEDLVAVEINTSNVQTNAQSLKESGKHVALYADICSKVSFQEFSKTYERKAQLDISPSMDRLSVNFSKLELRLQCDNPQKWFSFLSMFQKIYEYPKREDDVKFGYLMQTTKGKAFTFVQSYQVSKGSNSRNNSKSDEEYFTKNENFVSDSERKDFDTSVSLGADYLGKLLAGSISQQFNCLTAIQTYRGWVAMG
ncbi:hypothetical protein TNIN_232591 [Trichonephila inaurata madagascariensis]|uniref:Uncharacterized protein n=1 Tax=Trichonephila inaurata madagascariensis TaxID=2747483 RepID=A0A8X6WM12_9ARAC|nr:hypothetical protein TNIN_232591 [Trichonephila inaurata madagascariensis]